MTAYGYIRKSVVHDPARMLSPEMQQSAIRALGAANGDDDVTILSDLDVSGRKGRSRRPGWDELLRAVEEAEAHAVYAYSLSRFTRSLKDLREFTDLCNAKGIRLVVARESIDNSNAMGRAMLSMVGVIYELESEVASERVKDAFAAKRLRDPSWVGPGNRPYGTEPGEDAAVVVDAFKEAGSYDGAARLLYDRGVPTRAKDGYWYGTTVRDIVRRVAPDEVLPNTSRGSAAGSRQFRLSRLLRCSTCGTLMTGQYDRKHDLVNYYCRLARVTHHARKNVTESKLMPLVRAEAEQMLIKITERKRGSAQDEAKLAALATKRERWIEQYGEGLIDKPERDRRLAAIAEDESKLTAVRIVRHIKFPPDLERGDSGAVNAFLRRLFVSATVDMSEKALRGPSSWVPNVEFEWRDPSLRMDDAGDPEAA